MQKLQTTLEFLIITAFAIVVAIAFGVFYFSYVNKGIQNQVISDPNYVESFFPINSTSDLLSTSQPLVNQT